MPIKAKDGYEYNANKKAANARLDGLFGSPTSKDGLDAAWNEVKPELLLNLVWAVDALGGAVTLSTTRKHTAYVIKVYIGKAYEPLYFDGNEEGRAAMSEWVDSLLAAVAESG